MRFDICWDPARKLGKKGSKMIILNMQADALSHHRQPGTSLRIRCNSPDSLSPARCVTRIAMPPWENTTFVCTFKWPSNDCALGGLRPERENPVGVVRRRALKVDDKTQWDRSLVIKLVLQNRILLVNDVWNFWKYSRLSPAKVRSLPPIEVTFRWRVGFKPYSQSH